MRPGGRVLVGELIAGNVSTYRLRASGDSVTVRHRTRDVEILNEIFSHDSYRAPPSLLRHLNSGGLRALDLGGNIGLFGLYARSTWKVASIDSYEPDPSNFELLAATAQSAPVSTWRTHRCAVSNRTGTMRFLAGAFSESREADESDDDAVEVPVIDLFTLDHAVDVLKMDIEGGEWVILADARMRSLGARLLVMEWHARGCPADDPEEAVRALLADAGYGMVKVTPRHDGIIGTLWATR
jgi:FkbM family methyltransferase